MRVGLFGRRVLGSAVILAAGLACASCGGSPGVFDNGDNPSGDNPSGGSPSGDSRSDGVSKRLGNLLAFNSTTAPDAPKKEIKQTIDCPLAQIEFGSAEVRVGGQDSQSVRYQISIGDVARECDVANGQLLVRVGVEIRSVLGPAGTPGNYTAPLRIAIRRTGDEKILTSKTYTVGGAVSGGAAVINTLIAEPLSVPYTNEHAADDYEVVLAMGKSDASPASARRKR